MPDTLTDARKLLDGKLSVPGELRTAEWAIATRGERERAFYMAGVFQAEILEEFRKEAGKIVQGETSIPQAEKRLSAFLDAFGYKPAPGQESTIKDLKSWRRMRVALRTNVELLQGWGQKERGLSRGAVMAFPAWELIRYMPRTAPRNWDGNHPGKRDPQARWILAGGTFYGRRMIAMKDSPVWEELGNFSDGLHVDYPPFAWGSGMGWKAVGFREAKVLGVIPEGWMPPPRQPISSPNATLESTPQVTEPGLRKALEKRFQGMAEWQGKKLVFTDPNGTRSLPAEKIVEIWDKGMPSQFHRKRDEIDDLGLIQRHALKLWTEDHDSFTREVDPETGRDIKPAPGRLDLFDDLLRLFNRLPSLPAAQAVFRGMSWNQRQGKKPWQGFRSFLANLEAKGEYLPNPNKLADSWSLAESGARKYAEAQRFQVTLVCQKSRTAKDISALVRSVKNEIKQPDTSRPLVTDGEVIYSHGARFKAIKVEVQQDTPDGGRAIVYVEQL